MGDHQRGSAVIEVLISLSLAAFLIVVLGNLISAVRRMELAQDFRQRALTHTRESLEMVTSLQNELFACRCSSCSTTCLRNDTQVCNLKPGYNSCWTNFPYGYPTEGGICDPPGAPCYHLELVGSEWQLVEGIEEVTSDVAFHRFIMIENLDGDANRKKIKTEVYWTERGVEKNFSLSTILTGWANVTP